MSALPGPGPATAGDTLPAAAFAAALAGLVRMTAARLGALLTHLTPEAAFQIVSGADAPRGTIVEKVLAVPGLRQTWIDSARACPPAMVWERCVDLGIAVSYLGQADHPVAATTDPLPAPVLFSRGDRSLLDGRRVAIVGTRNTTMAGRSMALELGRGLGHAGVHVVSGLARGVDVHAHRGVLAALDARAAEQVRGGPGRPIGVVASGLDRVYPRENARVWEQVATDGLLLTEFPPGSPPVAHRFPLRNRLVAGLSEIVVVVESRERGGSLITASLAGERGIPVMAVPGSARNRAALGVNELLRDGAAPVLDVGDVLLALSLDHTRTVPALAEQRITPRAGDIGVYRVCARGPATIGEIAQLAGVDLLTAAMSLARLEQRGWLVQVDGWYESVGSPPR